MTDREEALNRFNMIIEFCNPEYDGVKKDIKLIRKALEDKEAEVVSVDEIREDIECIEYEVETPYRTINESIGSRVSDIIVNYLLANYPNGIIIKGE